MGNAFEITIGDGKLFVGVQIERSRVKKTMFLHQEAHVKKILNKLKMIDAKVSFREAVGSLMFLAVVTRPDIAYSVNSVSKFLSNHNESHWQAVKRIYLYLVGTTKVGVMYKSGGSNSEL